MPLARILTLHPEHAGALAHQLETHGYKVEFAHPGADTPPTADLLVNFDLCPQDEALARATELAQDLHCDIAVERGFEAEPAATAAAVAAAPAIADSEPALAEEPSVAAHYSAAAEQHFSSEQEIPVVDSALRSEPELSSQASPSPVRPEASKPSGGFVNTFAQTAAKALVSGRTLAADAWESARLVGQEYKQKLDLSRAERSALRRQRLLELENQKVQAQERAKELDAARQSAAQRLQQLLRERGEAADNNVASSVAPNVASSVAPSVPLQSRVLAGTGFVRMQMIRLMGHRYSPQTEAIITGVAAVTALFAVGLVVASFHPRAALSSNLDQPAPAAHGITVQTGGVTLKPNAAVDPAAAAAPVSPKASPVHRAQAGNETSYGSDVTVRNLRTKQAAASHRAQAKPAAVKLQPQDGIKHISDLDN